jgi:hypothetical protein
MKPDIPLCMLRDTFSTEDQPSWAPHGNGGVWRRRQTDEILRRHGIQPLDMEPMPRVPLLRKLRLATKAKLRHRRHISWSRRSLATAAYSYAFYQHNICRPRVARTILLEGGTDPVAFAVARDAGFKIIVSLSAIDSLWREGDYPQMFITEIENLRVADAVFCISREEQWLLGNLRIRAGYLPYFPDEERERTLLLERAARGGGVCSARPELLICATLGNTDTVSSFREQVDWIQQLFPENGPVFHVFGHRNVVIRDIWSDPQFIFHGTCSEEEFTSIKRRCCAVFLHMQKGLGAVTRVLDMLLAGLPVIANAAAARSFLDLEGVYLYDSKRQLRELLEAKLPLPPVPTRPVGLEEEFLSCLRGFL